MIDAKLVITWMEYDRSRGPIRQIKPRNYNLALHENLRIEQAWRNTQYPFIYLE